MKKLILISALLIGCNSTIKTARTITVKARGLDQIIRVFTPEEATIAINDLRSFRDSLQNKYILPDTNIFQVVNGVLIFKDSIILGNVTVKSLYVGIKPKADTIINHHGDSLIDQIPDTINIPLDSIINQIP